MCTHSQLIWCDVVTSFPIHPCYWTHQQPREKKINIYGHTTHRTAHTLVWHAALIYIGFYVKHFYLVQSQLNLFIAEIIYYCTFFLRIAQSFFSAFVLGCCFSLFPCKSFKDHRLHSLTQFLVVENVHTIIIFQIMDFKEKVAHYWHLFAMHSIWAWNEKWTVTTSTQHCVWHLNAIKCACRQMQAVNYRLSFSWLHK